ncbi:MAG: hypothetical protein OIF50_05265 [Flavobacteriaceae bacterium]|nr:hypothetical protein [Flavobacteriaceae bacterium]
MGFQKKRVVLAIALLFSTLQYAQDQDVKIFQRSDFELRGPVKICMEYTKYGQEEFYFSKKGVLTKSITRYNKTDYDLTIFRFDKEFLVEKRLEIYREGAIDKEASFAYFYSQDTTEKGQKTTEKIVNYLVELIAYNIYFYEQGNLQKVESHKRDGIDIFKTSYNPIHKNKMERSFFKNGVLESRYTEEKENTQSVREIRNYQKGVLYKLEKQYFVAGRLEKVKSKQVLDASLGMFKNEKTKTYNYDKDGWIEEIQTIMGTIRTSESHLYVLDGSPFKNWVKKIVRPSKNYWTREISYYDTTTLENTKQ